MAGSSGNISRPPTASHSSVVMGKDLNNSVTVTEGASNINSQSIPSGGSVAVTNTTGLQQSPPLLLSDNEGRTNPSEVLPFHHDQVGEQLPQVTEVSVFY